MIVSQLELLVAVHVHPVDVATLIRPVPPRLPHEVIVAAVTPYTQDDDAPAWLTVNVCPFTVIVPVRGLDVGLAATVNEMVALPGPLVPVVMLIQALLVEVHPQLAPVVSVNDPLPPAAGIDWDSGASA